MSVRTKKITVDDVDIHSTELDFCDATDLLVDMTAILAPGAGSYQEGISHMGDAAGMIFKELIGGRLTTFLARILARTTLIFKGEDKGKVELIDSREKLNRAFTGRQKYIAPAVELALEVSFKDFLGVLAGLAQRIQKRSPSEGSSASTESTG